MIGRSNVFIMHPDGANELHFLSSYDLAMYAGEQSKLEEAIRTQGKDWKPDRIVSDECVVNIINAYSTEEHELAGDINRIMDCSVVQRDVKSKDIETK